MSAWHLSLGRRGESAASDYLQKRGYRVLERNWRCRGGELDLICSRKGTIVFVEVKTRTGGAQADPAGAVNAGKRQRLSRAAAEYLTRTGSWDVPCRFDVVAILRDAEGEAPRITHYENAFELSAGGGWQPW